MFESHLQRRNTDWIKTMHTRIMIIIIIISIETELYTKSQQNKTNDELINIDVHSTT